MSVTYDFSGLRAVITGGASGIGLATAERFRASGAEVILWDRNGGLAAREAERLGAGVTAMTVDITSDREVAEAARAACADGPVQLLVNSAGIGGSGYPVWECDPAVWRTMIEVNLIGQFLVCRAFSEQMMASGWGRIVNVASVAGKEGNTNASAYSASKAGLIGFTKSLGKELIGSGVLANVVCPAVIDTPLVEQVTPEQMDYMTAKIPMGRIGEAGEVAALIAWLSSRDCTFSTGAVYDISGGRATY
jgi:NAD(P)-dependent dehydrogenase (short-subunit alcohol dehydrogenase family)